ncbi:PDDEXK nuclease domain-containing protein [Emticicia sp. 17c]|uniref:PDDEXK nuclease domain-containing protein n=1 Tax=Emticicia sp. 17c TaxID=3127704 RepID=UPI00301E213A
MLFKEGENYIQVLNDLKATVRNSRHKALLSVNAELLSLYWTIGDIISRQIKQANWGSKTLEKLAIDLRSEFPDMQGFSQRNLQYMRRFAERYTDKEFMQQFAAQIPWGHHILLIDKVKDTETAIFYINKTIENGWSRDILSLQIKSNLHSRQGKSISNFSKTITNNSDLVQQTFKDPYIFDFLTLTEDYQEKDLENALTDHITKFLLELGAGFAYVGKQYPISIGGQDFYIDLLFYNIKLHSYIVIELKKGEFKPEYAGKLNFYLSAVDAILRGDYDQESIGLLLCQDKNKVVAEYALKDINKPIGVSAYKIAESIPENLKGSLPSIEDIEKELTRYQEQK